MKTKLMHLIAVFTLASSSILSRKEETVNSIKTENGHLLRLRRKRVIFNGLSENTNIQSNFGESDGFDDNDNYEPEPDFSYELLLNLNYYHIMTMILLVNSNKFE